MARASSSDHNSPLHSTSTRSSQRELRRDTTEHPLSTTSARAGRCRAGGRGRSGVRGRAGSPCAQERACRSSKRTEPCAYPYSLTSCRVTTYARAVGGDHDLVEVGDGRARTAWARSRGTSVESGAPAVRGAAGRQRRRARASRPFFHRRAPARGPPHGTHPQSFCSGRSAAATRRAARIRPRRRWRRSDPSRTSRSRPGASSLDLKDERLTPRPTGMAARRPSPHARYAASARRPRTTTSTEPARGRTAAAPSGASCPLRAATHAHPSLGQRGRATSARGRDCRAAGRAARRTKRSRVGSRAAKPSTPTATKLPVCRCSICRLRSGSPNGGA